MKLTPKYKAFRMGKYAWDDLFYAVYQLTKQIRNSSVPWRMGPVSALHQCAKAWNEKNRFDWLSTAEYSAQYWQKTFKDLNKFNELLRKVLVAAWANDHVRYLPFDVCGALRVYWAMSFDILRDFSAEAEKAGVEGCDKVHPWPGKSELYPMRIPNPYV